MFSLIRGVIIVGLIVYFSPVRNGGEPEQHPSAGKRGPVSSGPAPSEAGEAHDGLLGRFVTTVTEEVVRTAVNDKVQSATLRLKEQVAPVLPPPSNTPSASLARSSERDKSSPGQSVRCVYRCDGTE